MDATNADVATGIDWSAVIDQRRLSYLLALVAAVLLTGVLAAIKQGTFDLTKLWEFARTVAIPYVGSWVVVCLLTAFASDEWRFVEMAAYGAIVVSLVAHVLGNLREMGIPGIEKLPDAVNREKLSAVDPPPSS